MATEKAERMYHVDIYSKIRRLVMVDGVSQREAARRFGIDRKSVAKMLAYSVPPGYRRKGKPVAHKLGAFVGIIDAILKADQSVLKKQRHTAQRIFERLRDEHQYAGGYTSVREYVARIRVQQQEMFVPLSHRPGHAQADFGEADIYLNGSKTRIHGSAAFRCDLCQSLSGGDHGGISRWPCQRLCPIWRRAPVHFVRQHSACRRQDPGEWSPPAHPQIQ